MRGVGALLACVTVWSACGEVPAPGRRTAPLAWSSDALRAELVRRGGAEAGPGIPIPHAMQEAPIGRAREEVVRAPRGREQVERLVAMLRREPPEGFGLRYDASQTATASEALAGGAGNCMTLASVLVGLARGIGWRAYYAEAGDPLEEEGVLEGDLGVLVDHMVVVIEGGGDRVVVDFLGAVEGRSLRVIDDLQATGHFLNNRAFESVWRAQRVGEPVPWEAVARRFELATRVDPRSARAWNNLGVAWAHVGRTSDARRAYVRARMLDDSLDSPERNLRVLRTRLSHDPVPAIEGFRPEAP